MKRSSPSFRETSVHRCLGRGGSKGSWPALGPLPPDLPNGFPMDPGTGASLDPCSAFTRGPCRWVDPAFSVLHGHRKPHPSFALGNSPRIIQSVDLEPRMGIPILHQTQNNLQWHLQAINSTLSTKGRSIFAEGREHWTRNQEASIGSPHVLARGHWWSPSLCWPMVNPVSPNSRWTKYCFFFVLTGLAEPNQCGRILKPVTCSHGGATDILSCHSCLDFIVGQSKLSLR